MALDNPSYFTIPGGSTSSISNRSGRISLLRKHVRMGTGSSSASTSNISLNKTKKSERYSVLPRSNNINTPKTAAIPDVPTVPLSENVFRRSFRSLLRTTSFDNSIQTQMLVLGMPRPSDVAPSNQHLPGSTKKHHNRNASTGKTYKTSGSDTLGPLQSSKQLELPSVTDTETSPPDDDRYYNVLSETNFVENRRRHSIGAYFYRKPSNILKNGEQIQEETGFCSDIDKEVLKWPGARKNTNTKKHASSTQRKCNTCTVKGGKSVMDDIVIVSSNRSQAADLWVTYLKTCFEQIRKNRNKPLFRILEIGIEETGEPGNVLSTLEEKFKNVKLAIFIVCPVFLEYIGLYPEQSSSICKLIPPNRVLAMLLGISESSITDDHKTALITYPQWKKMESVKDRDEKFVGDFLGAAMDIISKNLNHQTQTSEKCSFMLMPKKVNKSQNKVLILLNEPITKEDTMRVTIIRNNETFEIPGVKKRNPYTLIFRMPEEFLAVSVLVKIRVERNGTDLGAKLLKCESQLYALDQILRSCDNPMEFMCQALNIVPCDKDKLDDFLVSSFQRNIPPNFNMLQTTGLGSLHRGVITKEEYPTLLHFAARFGFEKLCWVLLECPGGELACDIRNKCELTPAEIAENAGYSKLANALCGYMQMTEFTSVYTFLKGMSDEKNNSSKSDSSDDYLNPRPLSETYQVPPSPRPLTQGIAHPPIGYMQMHSPKTSQSSIFESSETVSGKSLISCKEKPQCPKNRNDSLKKGEFEQSNLKRSRENSGKGTQDELIEIINDFKNNVFTISEVEKLVEEWRNRNDVQQSFREKQEQLNKMREEYERVQQKLKDEMKHVGRPSPMERIRNFFRSKSKDIKISDEHDKKSRQEDTLLSHRPSSSLSIQSSSSCSSGRLSTGSHCSGTSLGDSGTHSDAESERKFQLTSNGCCNNRKIKDNIENYDIPPNPVCLITSKQKSSSGILNYDIPPPSTSVENGIHHSNPLLAEADSCPSSDPQNNEVSYYNLVTKDIPVPNHSTLHNCLVGTSSKIVTKVAEDIAETKTENCCEYINFPSVDTTVKKCLTGPSNDEENNEISNLDVHLPDYVNVESSEITCK